LDVRCLTKSFGPVRVLRDVSFTVEDGEFCILLGPSGCGKTTLQRIVAGLEDPDGGQVWIGDREVGRLDPRERDVAMVFQSYALYPHMTVFENLAFPLKARRTPREEIAGRVGDAARLLGLEALLGRKPRELSGGQRQRVAIGRAIVRNPAVFLFDEPLSNLDAKLRSAMRVELAGLHRTLGATILYVTHDQVEAMTLGQKVVLLHEGRIQQMGAPRELYDRPVNRFVAGFVGTPAMNFFDGRLQGNEQEAQFLGDGLRIALGRREDLREHRGADVTLGIRPEALSPGNGEIEGRLELAETLGAETLLHLRLPGGARVVAKAPSEWSGPAETPVRLAVRRQGLHLFRDGARIGGGSSPRPTDAQ